PAHKEGELVAELQRRIGERTVSSKWTSLARRVWSSEQGERLLGALLEERLSAPSTIRAGAPSTPSDGIRLANRQAQEAGDAGRGRSRVKETPEGSGPELARTSAPKLTRSAPRRGGRRGEVSGQRSQTTQAASPAAAAPSPRSLGTIEPAEHQEFWEAWVDSKNDT